MSSTARTRKAPAGATRAQKIANNNLGLPAGSLAYFEGLARDAGNWSGTPWTDGNVSAGRSTPGYTNRLKAAGLIEVFDDGEGATYVSFTTQGVRAAAQLGIDLTPWYPEAKVNFKFLANRAKNTTKEGTTMSNVTPIRKAAAKAPAKTAKATKAAAPAAAPAKSAPAKSGPAVKAPAGFVIEVTRRDGSVFARNEDAKGKPPWLALCPHGTRADADRRGGGVLVASLAEAMAKCAKCKSEATGTATKAPAKAAAKAPAKKAPAKQAGTYPRGARERAQVADGEKLAAKKAAAPARKATSRRAK